MNAPVSVCGRELNLAVAAVGRGQQTADTARGDRSWSALFSGSRRLAEDGTRQTGGIQGLANDGGTATRQHTGLRVLVPVGHMGWVLVGYGIWVGDFFGHLSWGFGLGSWRIGWKFGKIYSPGKTKLSEVKISPQKVN